MLIDPKFYVLADTLRKEMVRGKPEDDGGYLPKLGQIVALGGVGDYLEIGTGFGASAIMAGIVKADLKQDGEIICIDPYPRPENAPADYTGPKPQDLADNAAQFKVSGKITLIPSAGHPLPGELAEKKFPVIFIDGNHDGMTPWLDFLAIRPIATRFVCFGGFEECFPGVMVAALRALSIGGWILHYKDGNFISLRRPVDVSDWMTLSPEDRSKRRAACQV